MTTLDHQPPKQSITILGTPDRRFNPIRKLISGFCDPFIPKHDDERTLESAEDSPQVQQHRAANTTATTTTKVTRSVEFQPTHPGKPVTRDVTVGRKLEVTTTTAADSSLLLPPAPDQKSARTVSELTIDSNVSSSEQFVRVDENGPEIQVSKKLTRQRRQHALQVFFASLIFVMATLWTLQKLGYTASIADFHAPKGLLTPSVGGGNAWGTRWIHVFDKTQALDGSKNEGIQTIKITKKAPTDPENDAELSSASSQDKSRKGGPSEDIASQQQSSSTTEQGELQSPDRNNSEPNSNFHEEAAENGSAEGATMTTGGEL